MSNEKSFTTVISHRRGQMARESLMETLTDLMETIRKDTPDEPTPPKPAMTLAEMRDRAQAKGAKMEDLRRNCILLLQATAGELKTLLQVDDDDDITFLAPSGDDAWRPWRAFVDINICNPEPDVFKLVLQVLLGPKDPVHLPIKLDVHDNGVEFACSQHCTTLLSFDDVQATLATAAKLGAMLNSLLGSLADNDRRALHSLYSQA